MEDVAKNVVFNLHPNYKLIHQKIYVRITNLPVYDQIRNIRYGGDSFMRQYISFIFLSHHTVMLCRQIHLNTMIRIGGVVTRRTGVFPQLQQVKYDCNKCGAILGPFFQNSYSEVKVGSCPECQSKGPFTVNIEQVNVILTYMWPGVVENLKRRKTVTIELYNALALHIFTVKRN